MNKQDIYLYLVRGLQGLFLFLAIDSFLKAYSTYVLVYVLAFFLLQAYVDTSTD